MQGDCSEILVRGQLLDIQGGARKNFEINKFLLKNGEINKFLLNSGEKNICTRAPCISSVTQNVGRNILASRECRFDVK